VRYVFSGVGMFVRNILLLQIVVKLLFVGSGENHVLGQRGCLDSIGVGGLHSWLPGSKGIVSWSIWCLESCLV